MNMNSNGQTKTKSYERHDQASSMNFPQHEGLRAEAGENQNNDSRTTLPSVGSTAMTDNDDGNEFTYGGTSISEKSHDGIDIRDAISILSSRAKKGGEKDLHQQTVTKEKKAMGQTLDVFSWTKMDRDSCDCGNSPPTEQNDSESTPEKKQQQRKIGKESQIKEELYKLTPYLLLQALFQAQKERVAAYASFNSNLDTILSTQNITSYPAIVADATAAFSVLSKSISNIREVLMEKYGDEKKDWVRWIGKIQQLEKEKLSVTAALHLEKIRERNVVLGLEGGAGDDVADERIARLLHQGVVSLNAKVAQCIEEINELLEELRYGAAEENEDE